MKRKKGITVKSIIENGIVRGWGVFRILNSVKKVYPESRANETRIKFYSGNLKRDGVITEIQHAGYLKLPRRKVKEMIEEQKIRGK